MNHVDVEVFGQQLVDSVLDDRGLAYLVLALHDVINKPIIVCDCRGNIIFEHVQMMELEEFDIEANIDRCRELGQYYLDRDNSVLYYSIGEKPDGYLIVQQVREDGIESILQWIRAAIWGFRIYFSKYYAVEKIENRYKNKMIHDLLYNNVSNKEEMMSKAELWGWDLHKEYFVAIIEPDETIDLQILYSYIQHIDLQEQFISTIRDNMIVLLCPVEQQRKAEKEVEVYSYLQHLNQQLEENFGFSFSMGIGQCYSSFREIHRSFQEAKTTTVVSKLMGEKGFVKRFLELGIFRLLYKCDDFLLEEYYQETLGVLIDHDKHNKGEFIYTLEQLFANNLDWGKTAESMFIHVNTLRYRVKKIEELLQMDFSKLQNQINLFIALKISAFINHNRT